MTNKLNNYFSSLKNKLHTFMAAQNLSRKYSDRLGKGDWLFENKNYWDLDIDAYRSSSLPRCLRK
jgi:hypothetical protein